MKFDLHIHSYHSDDSKSSVAEIINRAKALGLKGISITDHNTLAGSNEALLADQKDILIIPGAEYSTDKGHILVYFLSVGLETLGIERDKLNRFSWQAIVDEAHKQGALAFWAHPFLRVDAVAEEFIEQIDGIEVYNGRASNARNYSANQSAIAFAKKYHKPISAGSDGHWVNEIGTVFVQIEVEDSSSTADLLTQVKTSLKNGSCTAVGSAANRLYEPFSQLLKCFKTSSYQNLPRALAKLLYSIILSILVRIGVLKRPFEGFIDTNSG